MIYAFRRITLLLGFILLVAACGGGGSGSGDGPPPSPDSPGPADPPPSGEPDPDPSDNAPASASIEFPWARSSATASSVVVRGSALDPDGITKVVVNGLEAELSPAGSTGMLSRSMGVGISGSPGTTGNADAQGDEGVDWSVTVPLSDGTNEIAVEVEDDSGQIEKRVAIAMVEYLEVPLSFDLDATAQRVAGFSFNLDPAGFQTRLVDHRYGTGDQTVYPPQVSNAIGQCLRDDHFYYVVLGSDHYELHRFDLTGRHDSLVAYVSQDFLSADPAFAPMPELSNLECGPGHEYAYLLANHGDSDAQKSRILRIALDTGTIDVLSQTDSDGPARWTAWEMGLTDDALITLHSLNRPDQPLVRVDLETGARTVLTPGLDVRGLNVVPALADDIVYVVTFDGVDEIDLAAMTQRNVSEVPPDDPYTFSQPRSAAFDPTHRRVVMTDSDLDMLVAVDVDSGVRSRLLARSVGTGRRMLAPRHLAASQDMAKVYVADDGAQNFGKLIEIDLATGDRRLIGNIASQFSGFASGLALDEESRSAYVAFGNTILEIHLDSEAITAIASPATADNQIQLVSDLVFDAERDRLLVADLTAGAVVAINPATHQQTVLSQAGTAGAGPAFDGIVSMTLGADPSSLFVANQTGENVMRVDLANGDRQIELTQCLDDTGANVLGPDQSLHQVVYDGPSGRLLIGSDHVLSYDLAGSECSVLLPWMPTLAVHPGPRADQLLGTVFGGLVAIDIPAREYVIISK